LGGECAEGNELFEGRADTVTLEVAMKKAPDLILRQSGVGCLDRLANTVGDRVPVDMPKSGFVQAWIRGRAGRTTALLVFRWQYGLKYDELWLDRGLRR
jgi:hypothetical protein